MKKCAAFCILLVLLTGACSNAPGADGEIRLVGKSWRTCRLTLGMDSAEAARLFNGLKLGFEGGLFNTGATGSYWLMDRLEYEDGEPSLKLYRIYVETPKVTAPNGKRVGDTISADDAADASCRYRSPYSEGRICYEYDMSDYYFIMEVGADRKLAAWNYSASSLADVSEIEFNEDRTELTATFQNGKVLEFKVGMPHREFIEYMNENRMSYMFSPVDMEAADEGYFFEYVIWGELDIEFLGPKTDTEKKIAFFPVYD